MAKVLLIARHHFILETSKKSFLLILFSLPLFLTFTIGMGYLIALLEKNETTLGYIDQAGLLAQPLEKLESSEVTLLAFDSKEAAQAALDAKEINAYIILPTDYAETHEAELIYYEAPPGQAVRELDRAMRLSLLAGQSPEVIERVLSGAELTVRASDSKREFPGNAPNPGYFLPLVAAAIFVFLTVTTSGYMTMVLAEEKASRTVEIIVTSVSPAKMMVGKILGALAIAALQLFVWLVFFVAALWIGANLLDIAWLQEIRVAWRDVAMIVVVAVPTYIFLAALMIIVGSTMADSQDAQQAGSFSFLVMFLPIYLLVPLAQNPDGPLAVILSLIPGLSVVTMGLRSLFIEVPGWQIALSTVIGISCALLTIWMAGKAMRLSMLRYGQSLRLDELLGRRKSSPAKPAVAG